MRKTTFFIFALLAGLSGLWLAADPLLSAMPPGLFAWRATMAQYSGVLAIGCMSCAMILATRPRRAERWFGGLDKMYHLHKWLGISALTLSVLHWLWIKGPKWAVELGLIVKPPRGPRPVPVDVIEKILSPLHGLAEEVGEKAFYGAVLLILVALLPRLVSYRRFFGTHRILALAYLALVFHAVVLTRYSYWSTPLGLPLAVLLAGGTVSALLVLTRKVATGRVVTATLESVDHWADSRTVVVQLGGLETWPGHQAGQFLYCRFDDSEGAHPFTIASAWDPTSPHLTLMIRQLGDHTRSLPQRLRPGQTASIEGPYGCFTFNDTRPGQIWIAGGIGITPFRARLQALAAQPEQTARQPVTLFYSITREDPALLQQLECDAARAGIVLHLIRSGTQKRLDGATIRAAVPDWQQASLWFCGPSGFGDSLRTDFVTQGLPRAQFHQEYFAMR